MVKNFNLSDLLEGDPEQSKITIRPHEKVMAEILDGIGSKVNEREDVDSNSIKEVNTILPNSKNS
jgi:hypothetical protein